MCKTVYYVPTTKSKCKFPCRECSFQAFESLTVTQLACATLDISKNFKRSILKHTLSMIFQTLHFSISFDSAIFILDLLRHPYRSN